MSLASLRTLPKSQAIPRQREEQREVSNVLRARQMTHMYVRGWERTEAHSDMHSSSQRVLTTALLHMLSPCKYSRPVLSEMDTFVCYHLIFKCCSYVEKMETSGAQNKNSG